VRAAAGSRQGRSVRVRLSKSDRSFDVVSGESVLEAALRAGLNLPHSCKGGNCGACRARLIEGAVAYPNGRPLGLSQAEEGDGFVLLCQARARGDLLIETLEAVSAEEISIKRLPCRVVRAALLSHDVMQVHLKLPAAERFDFKPGQYVDIMLSKGRRRSFSIASPPNRSRALELHVRRAPGGEFTERLFAGGEVERALLTLEGPLGHFFYRETPDALRTPMLLVGGGTGLAPLMSIMRHVVDNGLEREMVLYWGVRSQRDLYAHTALEELVRRAPHLRYVPVLSEPAAGWNGLSGYVHEAVLRAAEPLGHREIYASGPPAMIEAVRREFPKHGADSARLYFDSFDYAPDSPARQSSTAASKS
jgi:CDP-4-dehydro-6-deoxyglucose reductase, E3